MTGDSHQNVEEDLDFPLDPEEVRPCQHLDFFQTSGLQKRKKKFLFFLANQFVVIY